MIFSMKPTCRDEASNPMNMGGLKPITLRFAELVGNVLRELPADREPEPKYKFYM